MACSTSLRVTAACVGAGASKESTDRTRIDDRATRTIAGRLPGVGLGLGGDLLRVGAPHPIGIFGAGDGALNAPRQMTGSYLLACRSDGASTSRDASKAARSLSERPGGRSARPVGDPWSDRLVTRG